MSDLNDVDQQYESKESSAFPQAAAQGRDNRSASGFAQVPNNPLSSRSASYSRYEYWRDETFIHSWLIQEPMTNQHSGSLQGPHRFPSNGPTEMSIVTPVFWPGPVQIVFQVQFRTTEPETLVEAEKEFDSCYDTLAKAKARANEFWKELYLQRYPGPPPPDVDQHLTYTEWYQWVQLHDPDRMSVWGKQLRFVDGFRIEMWVHEKVVH